MPRRKHQPPLHPGKILAEDFMAPLKLTGRALALALRVSPTRVSAILRGDGAISPDTAVRLGHYFGTSPWFWMNLQVRFELESIDRERPHPAARIRPVQLGEEATWLTGGDREAWRLW